MPNCRAISVKLVAHDSKLTANDKMRSPLPQRTRLTVISVESAVAAWLCRLGARVFEVCDEAIGAGGLS